MDKIYVNCQTGKVVTEELTPDELVAYQEYELNQIEISTKSIRISELKTDISHKQLLGIDCVTEQNELRTLLGL